MRSAGLLAASSEIERVRTQNTPGVPPGHGVAKPFLSAWSNFKLGLCNTRIISVRLGSLFRVGMPISGLEETENRLPCTPRAPVLTDLCLWPEQSGSVATGGDPHGTKYVAARTHGRDYSDINGRLHSMSKVILHSVLINFMRKLQVRLPVSEAAVPRAFEVEQGRLALWLARKFPGAPSTPQSQGRVVSDNTCRPLFSCRSNTAVARFKTRSRHSLLLYSWNGLR
ncbi:hypothetical protein BJY52DRAFT_700493 [Lactarius psammicola]|nr:hypothetical protein BJY52DRAFT_700493 [Lactarius psammicola]